MSSNRIIKSVPALCILLFFTATCTPPDPPIPPASFTLTYDGNGATGGLTPADSKSYFLGDSVIVADQGSLVQKSSTFRGWNTRANGSGLARAAGDSFAMGGSDLTLYAQWAPLGSVWTSTTFPDTTINWGLVAYSNGLFLAVANDIRFGTTPITDVCATSTDGVHWVARTMPAKKQWISMDIVSGDPGFGSFIVLAYDGTCVYTADGITWHGGPVMGGTNGWNAIGHAGPNVIGIENTAYPHVYCSDVLTSYTLYPSGYPQLMNSGNIDYWVIAYGGSLCVATSFMAPYVNYSSDFGTHWSYCTPLPWSVYSIAFGNGVFAALASDRVSTSANATTWSTSVLPSGSEWQAITYGDDLFLAASGQTLSATTVNIATSPDGITWKGYVNPGWWRAATYGNGKFVVVGNAGAMASTP